MLICTKAIIKAISNYESIVSQDVEAMQTTVNEIVANDSDIANQIGQNN